SAAEGVPPPFRSPQARISAPSTGSKAPSVVRFQARMVPRSEIHSPSSATSDPPAAFSRLHAESSRQVEQAASIRSDSRNAASVASRRAGSEGPSTSRRSWVPIAETVRSRRAVGGAARTDSVKPRTSRSVESRARRAESTRHGPPCGTACLGKEPSTAGLKLENENQSQYQ